MQEAHSLPWAKLPLPVLELVKSSCAELTDDNPHVQIDAATLKSYARGLDVTKLLSPRRRYPLNFPTQRSEVNFLCTLALLQIGSGWRRALHAQRNGKGAAETMTFGVMGMHISGEIKARWMSSVALFEVAQLFGLKIQEEYELQPGIYSERKTELYSLAEAITKLLKDTGSMLLNLQCEDWADYFQKHGGGGGGTGKLREVDPDTGKVKRPSAQLAVAKLVRHFSGLQDAYILPAKKAAAAAQEEASAASSSAAAAASSSSASAAAAPADSSSAVGSAAAAAPARVVYVLKKAQLMIAELYLRFGEEDVESEFSYEDIDSLTVMSDNVLPAMLRAHGVLKYSPALAELVDGEKKVQDREMEAAMRAAAVTACERIVREFRAYQAELAEKNDESAEAKQQSPEAALAVKRFNATYLDYALWLEGKEPSMRKLPRHATHSIFY